jgi:hypothetical protein
MHTPTNFITNANILNLSTSNLVVRQRVVQDASEYEHVARMCAQPRQGLLERARFRLLQRLERIDARTRVHVQVREVNAPSGRVSHRERLLPRDQRRERRPVRRPLHA